MEREIHAGFYLGWKDGKSAVNKQLGICCKIPCIAPQSGSSTRKVRVVEVGSGSGGTSVIVMNALAHLGDRIEFVYTDISPQLVSYGRKTYGPKYPFATFHLLDVEKDTEEQVILLVAA